MARLLDNVVNQLSRLPGVGRRTAMRLAMHILKLETEEADRMAQSISEFRHGIKYCKLCNNLSDNDICDICSNPQRNREVVCVVESVKDVLSIENSQSYNGLYHVLGGIISPMQGIGPSDLRIDLLIENIRNNGIKEVILALSTTIEGETTAFYISRRLADIEGIKVTEIARGLGFGDELDYADQMTINHAIANRSPIDKS